ncbi:MAG: diguanylate cyclase [Ktedonobacteraceae bacterium]
MKYRQYLHTTSVPWHLLMGLFLISTLVSIFNLIMTFNPVYFEVSYNIISILYPLSMALLCFQGTPSLLKKSTAPPTEKRTGQRFIPALLGTALLCLTFSRVVWLGQVLNGTLLSAFPSLSYLITLSAYPFFIGAFLLLPSYHLSLPLRLRIILDSLTIMTTVVTYITYFLLAPLLITGTGTFLDKTIASANPATDLIMLFCLLLVALRSRETALRPVLIMLGLATATSFFINMSRLQAILHPGYNEIIWNELLWVINCRMLILILITGAAQTVRRILSKQEPAPSASTQEGSSWSLHWKILLIGGLALICALLALAVRLKGVHEPYTEQIAIISVGGFIALFLLVLRQFLAVYEVSTLQEALKHKNRLLSRLNAQFTQQAITDPLTNLLNHRALVSKLEDELARARLQQTCCSIIFMDIDHFKNINDLYGHQTGDAVLHNIGTLIQSLLGQADYVGRWGGEEFIAVLPGEDQHEAVRTAEYIRRQIVQQHPDEDALHVTCSLGVATYPHDATKRTHLILSADAAMYTAKRLGRNQTRTAHEPMMLTMETVAEALQKLEEEEMFGMVQTLVTLQETRYQTAGQHARGVAMLSIQLAGAMGLSEAEIHLIGLGGLLHDLGKVTLSDALLFKEGELTDDEQALVAKHPIIGAEILNTIPALYPVAILVRAHHEWIDGSGYPDGLQGEEIPLGARIISVADIYDHLSTHHTPDQLRSPRYPFDVLQELAGSQLDPYVVEKFIQLFYPEPPILASYIT